MRPFCDIFFVLQLHSYDEYKHQALHPRTFLYTPNLTTIAIGGSIVEMLVFNWILFSFLVFRYIFFFWGGGVGGDFYKYTRASLSLFLSQWKSHPSEPLHIILKYIKCRYVYFLNSFFT